MILTKCYRICIKAITDITYLTVMSNEMAIRRDDIYQSDTIFHVADYVYGLQNAAYMGVEQYRKVNPDKYSHLSHRFGDYDSKGKVSLITEGCIFVEVLKDRTADIDFTNLYTIEIKPIKAPEKIEVVTPVFEKHIARLLNCLLGCVF